MDKNKAKQLYEIADRLSKMDLSKLSEKQLAERNQLIAQLKEVSDKTLTSYLTKVHDDSMKHEKDPTKRSPEKASKSVGGFARAFNKLDARQEQLPQETLDLIDEYIAKFEPSADRNELIRAVIKGTIHTSELEYALQDDFNEQGVAEGSDDYVKRGKELDAAKKKIQTNLDRRIRGKELDASVKNIQTNLDRRIKKTDQGVAEGSAPNHSELARLAHEAYIAAVRQGNAPMANHYKQAYEKHKRLAASERKSVAKGVAEGEEDSPVVNAITRRILMRRTDLLTKYGPEKVGQAIDAVADYVGDFISANDEIGSSDVSGWVRQVEQHLQELGESAVQENDLAQQMLALARQKNPNARLAGTPEQERERTQQMLAQRERDRAAAPKPAGPSPEERAKLEAKLKELEAQFDPNYEYSDDYSLWSHQNAIAKSIAQIKQRLAQTESVQEAINTEAYARLRKIFDFSDFKG